MTPNLDIALRQLSRNPCGPKHQTIHILSDHQIHDPKHLKQRTLRLCFPGRIPVLKAKRPDESLCEVIFERGSAAAVEGLGALVVLEGRLAGTVEYEEREDVG